MEASNFADHVTHDAEIARLVEYALENGRGRFEFEHETFDISALNTRSIESIEAEKAEGVPEGRPKRNEPPNPTADRKHCLSDTKGKPRAAARPTAQRQAV